MNGWYVIHFVTDVIFAIPLMVVAVKNAGVLAGARCAGQLPVCMVGLAVICGGFNFLWVYWRRQLDRAAV